MIKAIAGYIILRLIEQFIRKWIIDNKNL